MTISTPELQQCLEVCIKRRQQAIALSALGLLMLLAMRWLPAQSIQLGSEQLEYRWLYALLLTSVLLAALLVWAVFVFHRWHRIGYTEALAELNTALVVQDLSVVKNAISVVQLRAEKNPMLGGLLQVLKAQLNCHLDELTRQHLRQQVADEVANARKECKQRLAHIRQQVPLVVVEANICETVRKLEKRREQLSDEWDVIYKTLSWWDKLNHGLGPDFSEIDQATKELQGMHSKLLTKHATDFAHLDKHFDALKNRADARIAASQQYIERIIAIEATRDSEKELPLKMAMWLSALSVPISISADVMAAGNIYDALRNVNGNYASMSDTEIWWDTLFMRANELAGLSSLTKGAYFEQLVAADTGGTLFEHFNNPATDIIIEGEAFQLKATASAAYVNSVDENIPVIATSEVAEITRALDSGYSNESLTESVNLALGGSVVDIDDTAIDALLSGIGGLGVFATLQGINHAAERYNNGGDGVEALFEGFGVAIEGTARAMVGTVELGYKVLSSKPSQFVGRTVLSGLKKLDEKFCGE